jgi:hypothetical protein
MLTRRCRRPRLARAKVLVRFRMGFTSGLSRANDGLGVTYQCEGSLGLQHFADANRRLLPSPDRIKKLKYVVINGASVEPQYFSVTQMEGIILQDRHIASYAVEGLLVALIAEQGAVLGLARMWEAFVERIGWETKIFPSLVDAETWVRDRVKAKFRLDVAQFTTKT